MPATLDLIAKAKVQREVWLQLEIVLDKHLWLDLTHRLDGAVVCGPSGHLAKKEIRITESARAKRGGGGVGSGEGKGPRVLVVPGRVIVLEVQNLGAEMENVSAANQRNRVGCVIDKLRVDCGDDVGAETGTADRPAHGVFRIVQKPG